jgi:hypothetical protein
VTDLKYLQTAVRNQNWTHEESAGTILAVLTVIHFFILGERKEKKKC